MPGQPPYTRGIYATMHRGRTWTQRQLIGLGTPIEYNLRLKEVLAQGATATDVLPSCRTAATGAPVEPAAPTLERPEKPSSRLVRLRQRLAGSNALGRGLLGLLSRDTLDEDTWEAIEDLLIGADIGVAPTQELVERLRTRLRVEGGTATEARTVLREELINLVDPTMDRRLQVSGIVANLLLGASGERLWRLLFVAGLLEVGWAIGLKYTEGFTRPLASAVTGGNSARDHNHCRARAGTGGPTTGTPSGTASLVPRVKPYWASRRASSTRWRSPSEKTKSSSSTPCSPFQRPRRATVKRAPSPGRQARPCPSRSRWAASASRASRPGARSCTRRARARMRASRSRSRGRRAGSTRSPPGSRQWA